MKKAILVGFLLVFAWTSVVGAQDAEDGIRPMPIPDAETYYRIRLGRIVNELFTRRSFNLVDAPETGPEFVARIDGRGFYGCLKYVTTFYLVTAVRCYIVGLSTWEELLARIYRLYPPTHRCWDSDWRAPLPDLLRAIRSGSIDAFTAEEALQRIYEDEREEFEEWAEEWEREHQPKPELFRFLPRVPAP